MNIPTPVGRRRRQPEAVEGSSRSVPEDGVQEMGIRDLIYARIVRPVLFRLDPEVAHGLTIKALKVQQFRLYTQWFLVVLSAVILQELRKKLFGSSQNRRKASPPS